MVNAEPLYFLAKADDYKQGKINLLQAKSSLLISRNHVQNLKEISKQKGAIKSQIKRELQNLNLMIKNFEDDLPIVKAIKKEKEHIAPQVRKSPSPIPQIKNSEKVHIDTELNTIEAKLRELANM
jgi:hypothetical protein